MFLFYCDKTVGQQHGGGRIETYRNGVWCEVFSVENCNGKNIHNYLQYNIKVCMQQILCVFVTELPWTKVRCFVFVNITNS